MALELNHAVMRTSTSYPQAYWRISNIHIQHTAKQSAKREVRMQIDIFANRAAASVETARPVEIRTYCASLDDIQTQAEISFIDKCYRWLAAQPDFTNSKAA